MDRSLAGNRSGACRCARRAPRRQPSVRHRRAGAREPASAQRHDRGVGRSASIADGAARRGACDDRRPAVVRARHRLRRCAPAGVGAVGALNTPLDARPATGGCRGRPRSGGDALTACLPARTPSTIRRRSSWVRLRLPSEIAGAFRGLMIASMRRGKMLPAGRARFVAPSAGSAQAVLPRTRRHPTPRTFNRPPSLRRRRA